MLEVAPLLLAYAAFVAGVLGLCMGSFLNCLAWRMTHGESVLHGRSHCTSCGHVLGPLDLIPVFSWLASRGRCRYCHERVSWRYPATEIFCALMYVSVVLRYGLTLETVELIAFVSVLLVLSLTDIDEYVIPNGTIIVALCIRLAYIVAMGLTGQADLLISLRDALVGGFAVAVPVLLLALVMDHVLGRESLGGGDVKLLFVAGTYFGVARCLFLIIVSCVLGILFAFLGGSGASQEGDEAQEAESSEEEGESQASSGHLIPFGPSIAAACWITMLVGDQVVSWYLGLF